MSISNLNSWRSLKDEEEIIVKFYVKFKLGDYNWSIMKNMNQQEFNKMFGKFFKGFSAGGALLLGLGLFAMNSYYYGIPLSM